MDTCVQYMDRNLVGASYGIGLSSQAGGDSVPKGGLRYEGGACHAGP